MMHLGAQELIVILLIVLILFGGKKVTGLGKALGTSLREFKEEVNKPDETVKKAAADTPNPNVVQQQATDTVHEARAGKK